jgi:hypothetical protein
MNQRIGRILLATGALAIAGVIGFASHSYAQRRSAVGAIKLAEASQTEHQKGQKKGTVGPNRAVTPGQTAIPRQAVTPRRTVTPKLDATPRRTVTPKLDVTPRRAITTKQLSTKKQLDTQKQAITPRVVAPTGGSSTTVRSTSSGLRAIGTSSTGRTLLRGQNYTVWRGSHRVRYGNRWRTFAALSALSVFVVGGSSYYPYAYISAPEPICEGETEDGCILKWEEVPTLEGPRLFQCVAYCPWQ